MSEATKIAMVKEYWRHSDEGLRDEFARMQKGFAFYVGDQWDSADLEKLYVEKRPALTINLILLIIGLGGLMIRQRRINPPAG